MGAIKIRRVDLSPDEWIAGTVMLDNAERGLYITACALIYSNDGPIPIEQLRAATRDHGHAFKRQLQRLLDLGKLTINDGQISNKRCVNELQKAHKRSANARENGGKSNGRPTISNTSETDKVSAVGSLTINHQPSTIKEKDRSAALRADFAAWYAAYPRKVARAKAEKAYAIARRTASADELLVAIERYRQSKPAYADWKHPATWLNGQCWLDDYADPAEPVRTSPPPGPPPSVTELWPDAQETCH